MLKNHKRWRYAKTRWWTRLYCAALNHPPHRYLGWAGLPKDMRDIWICRCKKAQGELAK